MKKVVQTLSTLNQFSSPPLWLMRQAGRYLPEYQAIRSQAADFMKLCFTPELASEITLQPIRRFQFDAAIIFSDILVIPHVLGQSVTFKTGEGPLLTPVSWQSFFQKAHEIDLSHSLSSVTQAIKAVRTSLPSETTLIGFAGSPWTIATYMVEGGKSQNFSKILTWVKDKNPFLDQLMLLLEQSIGQFLNDQILAGADVVQIFDSWAEKVPHVKQEHLLIFPIRRIITALQKTHPNVPIIYYGRGVSHLYPKIGQGLKGVSFSVDQYVPVSFIRNTLQPLTPVQGNLDPQLLLEGGDHFYQKVQELLQTLGGKPYVFNLGHGILPQTPVDHVYQLVEWVRKFGT